VEYALSNALKAHGVVPSVVMGHSLGEIVASCLAGVMSMEDAMLLVAERSRLMQEQPAGGSMVAVFVGEAEVQEALARHVGEGVAIAAVNGPKLTVIAGPEEAVAAIVAETNSKHQRLKVSHAFHSPLMGHVARELQQVLEGIELRSPVGPLLLISNVTGAVATAEVGTAEYWCRHVLQPVLFQRGVEAMCSVDVETYNGHCKQFFRLVFLHVIFFVNCYSLSMKNVYKYR
jgi:acyl transferase domain-containing protein